MTDYPTVQLPPGLDGPPEPIAPPVRRRRGLHIMLIAVVAALVLAVPLVFYFALRGDSQKPETAPPPTVGPTATVPATPTPAPTATPRAPAPDGRISLAELKNATLDIPAWPADNLRGRSGPLTFVNGQVVSPPDAAFPYARYIVILATAYGDVDRDGAQETLAQIGCVIQGGSEQIVAFDRDAAGHIVTMGAVVATTGDLRTIDMSSVYVPSTGTIPVRVGDFQRCCGDQTPQLWQVRTYGWNGQEFRQVGGPTSFPVNPSVTETGVKSGELVFGPAVGGMRHGTLTVTVTYLRGARPDQLRLEFTTPVGIERDGASWPPIGTDNYGTFYVDLPTPALGGAAIYTFAFSRPVSTTGGEFHVAVAGLTKQDVRLSESNPYNNGGAVTVRTTD